jgi:threonine efflux protein
MDPLTQLLALLAVHWLAMMTPGPNTLLVTRTALARSRRAGVLAAFGITLGNLVWSTTAIAGLALVIARVGWLYDAVRVLGGLYLLYLAWRLWRAPSFRPDATAAAPAAGGTDALGTVLQGLLTNLANPKSALYFTSIFAAFFPPGTPAWLIAAAVPLVAVSCFAWYCGLACAFSLPRARRVYLRAARLLDRVAGTLFALFGLRLLLTRWV